MCDEIKRFQRLKCIEKYIYNFDERDINSIVERHGFKDISEIVKAITRDKLNELFKSDVVDPLLGWFKYLSQKNHCFPLVWK